MNKTKSEQEMMAVYNTQEMGRKLKLQQPEMLKQVTLKEMLI